MNYINVIIDSIETAITMKFFKNKQDACFAHVYKSKLLKFPMLYCKTRLNNFNPGRLQNSASKAYPKSDRPRGQRDLDSVNFYKKQKNIPPIWILKKNKKYFLLDGAHRLVANFIKKNKYINAYIVKL